MDSSQLNSLLNRLCKILWSAQVTNPITYVTQISYLIFLKMLEEMEAETALLGKGDQKTLFAKFKIGGEEIDYKPLRWSLLTSDPDNDRMLRTLRDTLPLLAQHPRLSLGAKAIFDRASVVIPDGATLKLCVDVISPVSFLVEDADVKGDLFEMLASNLGGQKLSAQFRTPRHLVRIIVEMVDPRIGETICDSACGSGGFLIAAYDHIILRNTSPEMVYERTTPYGTKVKKGVGDRLTKKQWDFLQSSTLHGFEGDQDIIRMAAMNAVLHQFDQSPLIRRDSICGGEDIWDETYFDVILENPPFSGARNDAKRSLRLDKGDKYVLFLAHALRSLKRGGRAGIIFPTGILFGDTGSHLEVKRRLLNECDLQAVVLLPKGMFEPYTPNPTCFLIFEKTGKPTKTTWFYKVDGDGSSLKKARKFGPQYKNDFPDLLAKWPKRKTEDARAWVVPVEKIVANGYNMSLTSLGLIESPKTDHLEPGEILASVAEKERKILVLLDEVSELLNEEEAKRIISSAPHKMLTECGEVFGGGTPAKANPDYWNGSIPWITAKEMKKFEIGDSDLKITESALKASPVKLIPPNSVLFVVRGSILYRYVPVAVNRVVCTINQDMKAIIPHDFILGDYLAYMMIGANDQLKMMVDTAGNSAGKLGTEKWSSLVIPVPDLKKQHKLIDYFSACKRKVGELIHLQSKAELELAAFTPSLLAKAFRGEL